MFLGCNCVVRRTCCVSMAIFTRKLIFELLTLVVVNFLWGQTPEVFGCGIQLFLQTNFVVAGICLVSILWLPKCDWWRSFLVIWWTRFMERLVWKKDERRNKTLKKIPKKHSIKVQTVLTPNLFYTLTQAFCDVSYYGSTNRTEHNDISFWEVT